MIPKPLKETSLQGKLHIEKSVCFDYGSFAGMCTEAFRQRTGAKISCDGTLVRLLQKKMGEEAYILNVTADGVEVQASCEKGVIWALTTLYKLIDKKGDAACCIIEDEPKYGWRGQSLDCSRHFFPVSEVKKIIEGISLFKMNRLHWHLSDDQGWRIESRKYPRLNEVSGEYYTWDEIREIVDFALERGVEIVPEIDMPGHVTAILAAYPQYSCTGDEVKLRTDGGIFNRILCAGNEEVFAFIEDILDEICPLFPYEKFHIGGDEAPKKYWKDCPGCKRKMNQLGLSDTEQLQGWFSARVAGILKKYGKKPVGWNEILQSDNIPEDIFVQYWTIQHRKSAERYVRENGRWIYSNMFELYFDYPYSMTPLKRVYGIKTVIGKENSRGMQGVESCIWAERISTCDRLEELLFPRVCAAAEIGWGTRTNYTDFVSRLKNELTVLCKAGITYRGEEGWNPKGRKRSEETVDYVSLMGILGPDKNGEKENTRYNPEVIWNFLTKFLCPADIPHLLKMLVK